MNLLKRRSAGGFLWLLILVLASSMAHAVRIKEIAAVQGVRSNQLTGYGLVIGLDGTGDQSTQVPYTAQSIANYLQQQGVSVPAGGTAPQLRNVAAVEEGAPAHAQTSVTGRSDTGFPGGALRRTA